MAEQWNAGNDQFHAAMQRRLDSPSRYLPGAPQRTTQGAVEDAMGAMMSGNSRPVVLGISGMPQGGGQAADGQGTSGSLAQAAVGPRPAGYTRNESGEMVPQWELPDGTLTTSFMTVEDAQYQANQARGIMEQERKRESALHQATVAADKAIEDEIGAYAAEQRRGNDVNLWDINPDTGVNIAGVNRYFDIEGQRARLYEGMGERIYNLLPADVRQSELANYQQYFASHPQEIPQGMTAAQAAEQSLRGWCDQQAYSYLVGKQAPQGSLEFLGRKIVELNPAFPQMWSQLNAARQGNATLAVADQQAMSDYGAKHRALDITGTVLNMAADPLNFVGGGAASMVGKGVARAVFRKTGTNLAARLMTSRLGTSMIQGAAHGATAFAIYEGGKSIERQLTTNNYNFETGQFQGFSWGDVGSSMRHGAIMGAATGWIAPIVGNTSSKLAAGVSSTGAKAATRAGVHAVGIGVEAGIFSTASYFESGQFDFWDNLAFIVGMKASHGGRRTVSEVLGAALNRNKPFGEWIRERVSRDSREYQFTDGELAEMREAGYGRLSALFARAGRSKASEADGVEVLQSVSEREYDGYDNVRRLMSDNQVSQATRAKVYWWLTGRKLPMSSILGAEMVTEDSGDVVVIGYTNGGEVVLRERFKSEDASKAQELYDTYTAQAESNLIEFGEQVRDRDTRWSRARADLLHSVANKLNVEGADVRNVFRKLVKGLPIDQMTASERIVAREIISQFGTLLGAAEGNLSFGEGTSNILKYMVSEMAGVDVEAALKKGAPARSEAEQRAVDMYIDALYSQNARAARSRQLSGTKIEGDEAQAPADEAQPIEVAQAAEEARPAEEYAPKYRAGNILVGEGENARWLVLTGRENPEYQGLYEVYDPDTKEVSYYTESELDEVVKEYVEFDTVVPSEAEVEAMAHSRDGEEAGEVPEGAIRIDQPAEEVPAEVPEGAIRIDRPEGEGEKPAAEVPAAETPRAEAAEVPAEAPVTEAPAVETTAEEAPKAEAPAAAPESALARIPVAEDGAPIFTAVDAQTAWAGLREFFGDTQAALDYATNMINAAQKRADKASKTSVPFSENPLKYRENLQKVREAVDKANAELAQWQAIAAEAQRAQEAVEMQQNAEAAAERGVVAFQPTGTVKERWDNSEKVYGLQSVIVLPDGTRVRGRYVLSHVDAATASHQPANSFARSEGFPVNENGTTINDRDYEHDKAAQEQVRKTASAYDRRALLDMPVVQDGVVLSGNERTMAAQLAARQGTNADYIAGMKESVDGKTNRWGIPLADVERFGANAAIRFEVEEVLGEGDAPQGKFPLNTKTMRRFNVKATKDQSKTEKTITFAKAMSDHTYNQLTRVVFGAGETLSDFYGKRAAVLEALSLLVEQGEITDREMPKYWDDVKGQITEEGKDLIENALLGKYFADNEQVVRVLAGMGMVRTAVVAALPELSRNAQFRAAGYDLQKEVAEAILFIKKVKDAGAFKSGVPVSGFNLQNDFFDGEFGDTKVSHVSVLMIADLLNDKRTNRFREVLSDYNDFANGPANGQIDAFEGRPLSREEVLRPIIDKIQTDYNANYGRARITEPAEAGERKQPTEVEQSGRTEQPAERAEAVAKAEDALEGDAKEQVAEGDKSPSPETKTSDGKVEPPAEEPAEAVIEKPAAETKKAEETPAEAPKAEERTEVAVAEPAAEQVNEIAERVNRGIDEYTNMLYTYLSVPEGEEIPAQFIEQFDAMSKSLHKDLVDYFKSEGNTEDEAVARARDTMGRVRAEATAAIASRSREGMVPEQPAVSEPAEKPAEVSVVERPKAEAEAKPAKVAKPKPQPKAEPAKPQPKAESAKPEAAEAAPKPAKKAATKKPVAKEAAPAKLEDFGEKILGARKDALKELSKSLDNANAQSFVALPLTKAFSRPNVKKLVEAGVLNESEALFVEAVSVMILGSRKPSVSRTNLGRFKLERWAAQMQECAQLLKKFVEGDAEVRKGMMDALKAEYEQCKESGEQISPMGFAFAVLERAGLGDMSGYKPVTMDLRKLGDQYFISVSKNKVRVIGRSLEEAVSVQTAALQIKNGISEVELPMSSFRADGTDPKFVGSGNWIVEYASGMSYMSRTFSSKEEAEAYMAKNPGARMKEKQRFEGYEHFVIECRNPLNGERVEVDFGMKFGSKPEAESYIEEHLSELSAKAVDKIFAEEKVERKPKQYYFVSKDYETGEYFVHYDIWIHSIHKTREEAVEAANKLNEEYAALVEKGRKITYFSTDERPRVGRDWRGGHDATPEMFTEAFAFRGVQFGNWTNGRDRQEALNQAYDAFMDLAEVLGKSPKAMSLNGELGLAFGARGSGAASAHYEPEQVVINLTKTKGAGSLAHEWWHALDNYFARRGGIANGFATESNQVLRGELASDVRNLLQAIDKSAYGKRCARMSAYWRSTIEVTARLFAEYVSAKIHRRNGENSFLSRGVDMKELQKLKHNNWLLYLMRVSKRAKTYYGKVKPVTPMTMEEFMRSEGALTGFPYPTAEEVRELEPYLDAFVGDIREDEGGAMYQKVSRVAEVGDVVRVADEVDAALVDALAERMSSSGIEVVRDGSEGQRVLDEANGGVRYDFASSEEEFEQRHRMAVGQRGVVAAGLGQMSVPVVDVPRHDFAGTFKEAVNAAEGWARANLTGREYTYGKNGGRYSISGNAVEKFLSQSAMKPSENAGVHLSALKYLPQIIEQSIDVEIHPDYVKGENSLRAVENGIGRGDVLVHRLYGCINIDGQLYRVKTTMYEYRRTSEQKKNTPHSYEVTKIELLEAPWWNDHQHAAMTSNNSISGAKLLQNVEKSYEKGKKVLEESRKNGTQLHKVYHGSGADFDAFDFGHMGEGEGAQAFGWGGYVTEVENIGRIYGRKKEETSSMMLYTIDIPEDNGRNYLHWEKTVGENAAREVRERLYEHLIRTDEEGLYGDAISRKELERELAAAFSGDMVGGDLYGTVSSYLGSDKAASEFLHDMGIVGVSYPAGERNDMARNYVIFRESDMRITDKVRFFRTKDGEAYGFTVGGKIYIDPRYVNAETPIHEYTHLWAEALRRGNAEEWRNVIELMRGTSVWDEVREQYPELKTEDEIAEEVLAQYSGRRGAERLREEMRKAAHDKGATMDKARAVSVLERVRLALERFWRSVADFLHVHFTSAEEVADRVLADLLNGVNPLRSVEERAIVERAKADGTYMKAPNGRPTKLSERQWVQVRTKAFKEWFGDWEMATKVLNVVSALKEHGFKNFDEARAWAKEHIVRTLTDAETGGKGEIRVSNNAVAKFLSESSVAKSASKDVHLSVLKVLPDVIRESVDAEQHPDYKKGEDGSRSVENGVNEHVTIHRLYGAVNVGGKMYRVKVTLKEDRTNNEPQKAYSYEATKIELLAGQHEEAVTSSRNSNNSITAANLLKNVEKSYGSGEKLLDSSKILDENGEPLVMWHETGNVFTTFNPRRVGAGASDYMTPFGIFLKDSPAPIGVARGGDVNQMALYVKMQNPIEFANREEMESYLRSKCEGYAQLSDSIKNIDAEYGKKYDDAEKAEGDAMMDIYLNHPEIWSDEARRDEAVEKYSSEVDRILKEWQEAEGKMSAELKEITDRFFRSSGHDGIILNTDEGSFGRKTRTNIVFNPNQVKSATENVGAFDGGNADIRYQKRREGVAGPVQRSLFDEGFFDGVGRQSAVKGSSGGFEPEVMFGKVNESTTEGEVADGGVGLLYRAVDDRAVLDEFAEGKTVKVYRTMQVIDGKLYSPMATKVGGKSTPEIRLGVVEQSEEHPEIIKHTRTDAKTGEQYGYVVIDKGQNKGTLEVAYNPYMHCSRTVLNDQFTSAHIRPNLVIVEVEVPASELSSGYRANMAKNSVGEMSWHSGSVSGKLSKLGKPRRVILSRYDRPVRVVPFREVAEKIAEQLAGTDIEIPYNVVQPQLREELEALGVRISEKASGSVGKKNDFGKAEYITDEDIAAINARAQSEQTVDVKRQRAEEAASEMGVQVRFIESKDIPAGVNAERQRRALGWFDPATGEVVVALDNNADAAEAVATVYHEVVAHKGLRELVGKENMSTFLRQVYAAADETIRREIAETAARHGYNMETATEEYLARLAEKGFDDFTPKQRSLWKRLRDFIVNLLRKCLRLPKWVKLHDNELRQVLYASYENLKGKSAEARGKSGAVREAASAEGLLYSDGMDLEATVTKGKIDLALRNQGDRDLREQAIAAINGNLQQLRRAMRAQRNYDQSTAKSLTDLVRAMIGGKQLHGMSDYELSRLFVAIRDAVGRDDYSKQVDKVMDILIKNQLSQAEEALDKLMKIRGSKVDAKGVEVQGELDLRGQAIVKEFKSALKLSNEDLDALFVNAQKYINDPSKIVAEDAQDRLEAYMLAKAYNTLIRENESKEQALRLNIHNEELRYKAGQMSREEWRQFEAATRDAIRENQMQRVEYYYEFIKQLADTLNQSISAAKSFVQAQQEHVRQIQHEANSDLQGVPYYAQGKKAQERMQKIKNSPFVQLFTATLPSFDAIMRLLSKNSPNGEGYLWNRFMRGFVDAVEQERTAYLQAKATLDKEVQMIFGTKYTWDKLAHRARKMKLTDGRRTMAVTIHDGGAQRQIELTSGELMYLYMANKMTDGEMKLRYMGITEGDIAAIEQLLDPRLVELADWLQEVFFVGLREQYNEVHKRMFGASMAAIDNYVPLKILGAAIQRQEDIAVPDVENKSATTTGAVIKRTVNVLPIDLMHCNIFEVVNNHVQEMNHWAAFAELSRDLNTLLSYNLFKNRIGNMQSVLGGGDLLYKRLKTTAAIMTGNYRPKATRSDRWAVNIAKGVTAAKVVLRMYTAFKQFSSMPAFLSEARPKYFVESMTMPWKAFNWCMDNLPMFEKRWVGRLAGNERLMPNELDWGVWQKETMEKITRWGLTPNGFVDAVTVAIGAYAIYKTRYQRYLHDGYTQADADKRARQDANILVNKSQQSSESAFLSEMQVERSVWSVLITAFRNSPISYQRMVVESTRNIYRRLHGDKKKGIEFMKKQLLREWGFDIDANGKATGPDYNGMDADTADGMAEAAAKREYRRSWMRDIMNVGIYGFVMEYMWYLFGTAPLLLYYLLTGKEEETKQILQDTAVHAVIGGQVEGLTAGELISDGLTVIVNSQINDTKFTLELTKTMPIAQDMERIGQMYGYDAVAATNELVNVLIGSGFGFNPATLTDAGVAIYDACQGDMDTMREVSFCLMRIFQVPQSQLDKMYFDELGCTGAEARRMSPAQVAERYAQYKVMRSGGLMQWMYSDELYNRRVGAYRQRAMTILKGKMPSMWSDEVNNSYEAARAPAARMPLKSKVKPM